MWVYLARRVLVVSTLVIAGVSVLTFSMLHLVPGDPVRLMYGRSQISQETMQIVRRQLGLDLPLPIQYMRFVSRALTGDLGRSIRSQQPVAEEILARAPATFQLAGAAMLIAVAVGAPLGLLAALNRGKAVDRFSMILALLGVSVPQFWLGLVFIFVFAVSLNWLPVSGAGSGKGLILPAVTLGLAEAGLMARLFRSSMLDVFGEAYLVAARAKGASWRRLVFVHAIRNALIPVTTIIGLEAGYLLAGSVIAEVVFARPGLGSLAVQAILDRDFPVVQGVVLFTSVTFILLNILVDLLYAVLDPRIRLA